MPRCYPLRGLCHHRLSTIAEDKLCIYTAILPFASAVLSFCQHRKRSSPAILSFVGTAGSPGVSFRYGVRGDVALVVESLPYRSVVGVGVRPCQAVVSGRVLVEKGLENVEVVRISVSRHESSLLGLVVALYKVCGGGG